MGLRVVAVLAVFLLFRATAAVPYLQRHHHRLLEASGPSLRECFTGSDLLRAFVDPAVRTVLIKNDITLSNSDCIGYKLPLCLDTNITVRGPHSSPEQWPVLDLGNLQSVVWLRPGVSLNISLLVLWNWRNSPHFQAPGLDFIANDKEGSSNDSHNSSGGTCGTTDVTVDAAAPAKVVVGWNAILIHRTCLPIWMYLQSVTSLPRPRQLPPGPQNATILPRDDPPCDPSSTAPEATRCWPAMGMYYDTGFYAMHLDPYGTTTASGYIVWLHAVQIKCLSVMNTSCVATYGAVGCYYAMFPRASATGGSTGSASSAAPTAASHATGSGDVESAAQRLVAGGSEDGATTAAAVGPGSVAAAHNDRSSSSQEQATIQQQQQTTTNAGRGLLVPLLGGLLGGAMLLVSLSVLGLALRWWRRRGRSSTPPVAGAPPCKQQQQQLLQDQKQREQLCRCATGDGGDGASGFGPGNSDLALTVRPISSQYIDEPRSSSGQEDDSELTQEPYPRSDTTRGCGENGPPSSFRTTSLPPPPPPPPTVPLEGRAPPFLLHCLAPEILLEPVTSCTPLRPGVQLAGSSMQEQLTLLPGSVLGKGSFGRVLEGRFRGERVAVKMINTGLMVTVLATRSEILEAWHHVRAEGQALVQLAEAAVRAEAGAPAQGDVSAAGDVGGGAACCGGGDGGEGRGGGTAAADRLQCSRDMGFKSLVQEVAVLARCQHPNIVRLLAASLEPPRVCLVMELMDTSLDRMIHGSGAGRGPETGPGSGPRRGFGSAPRNPLMPLCKVLHIGIQIARALSYLHPTILHRDLKPANVLISWPDSDKPIAKLADFGLSRLLHTVLVTRNPEVGTGPYMAPEAFDITNNTITDRADVYALGVILWELLSGCAPWSGLTMMQIAFAVTVNEDRLPLHHLSFERCPPKLRSLLVACWDADPARRPAAAEAVKVLALVQQVLANDSGACPPDC